MNGGFSFCGVDIAKIGLEYAPEIEDTYVYKTSKARIHEETYDGHDGGYYYGSSREPKEFILRCIFEEEEIDRGLMAKVYHLFKEGKTGRLIFSRRPWCYYYATVTDLDTTGITNYLNGVIKITMKAYYPFARADTMVTAKNDDDYYRIRENTAFFENEAMVPPVEYCKTEPITKPTDIILANPGTELAHVGIEIAGDVGKGVIITNHTTNQTCKFVAMSESEFDGNLSFVYLDGMNGKCSAVKDGFSSLSFLYHDEGFIQLAPGFPMRRNVLASVSGNEVKIINNLYDRNSGDTRENAEAHLKGKFIWLSGAWHEITGVGKKDFESTYRTPTDERYQNQHLIYISDELEQTLTESTCICQLNKITIEPVSTMKLTRLKFVYKPTFS